jgi:hypothetical protein
MPQSVSCSYSSLTSVCCLPVKNLFVRGCVIFLCAKLWIIFPSDEDFVLKKIYLILEDSKLFRERKQIIIPIASKNSIKMVMTQNVKSPFPTSPNEGKVREGA